MAGQGRILQARMRTSYTAKPSRPYTAARIQPAPQLGSVRRIAITSQPALQAPQPTWWGKPECSTELRATSHRSVALSFHTWEGGVQGRQTMVSSAACVRPGAAGALSFRTSRQTHAQCPGHSGSGRCMCRPAQQMHVPTCAAPEHFSTPVQNKKKHSVQKRAAHLRSDRVLLHQRLLGEVDLQRQGGWAGGWVGAVR